VVQYKFDLTRISAFGEDGETVAGVSFYVYDKADLTTNIPSMLNASGYGDDYVTAEIRNDVSGHVYYLAGVITSSSNRKYVVLGRFSSNNLGVSAT
jgi:hypothetical protein